MIKRHGLTYKDTFGIESVAFQESLVYTVQEQMFRRKQLFEVTKILHGNQDKGSRVEGVLQPLFANGFITFQRTFPRLQTQLLDWPNGKRDAPDALAMAIKLFAELAPMFAPVDAAKDRYKPLSEVFGGDWRKH